MPTASRLALLASATTLAVLACNPNDFPSTGVSAIATLQATTTPETSAPAASDIGVDVLATDRHGDPLAYATFQAAVTAGGGDIDGSTYATDANGHATFRWNLGVAPVANRLELSAFFGVTATVTVIAEPPADPSDEVAPTPFGDVNAWLNTGRCFYQG